ncbi:MAG: hypothetical protein HC923_08960 [Myxococcales bacterium]|nr:hypothetical protein [Myxococcales bacterium]
MSLLGGSASAQELREPGPRQGYFLGGGLRAGSLFLDANEIGDLGGFFMTGGAFRFGEMVFDWLGLGGQVRFASGQSDDFDTFYGAGMMEAQVQPLRSLNLAFRSSAGAYGQGLSRRDPVLERDDEPGGAYGAILTLGASYDWFPFRRSKLSSGGLAFTLYADGEALLSGDIRTYGIMFGLEVTYFLGLRKYKLDLPVEEAFDD